MGISGLIPFLEKASTNVNIKDLEGSSVAVDSYCWLHRGAFACAEKLIRQQPTDIYVHYCLKYVDMLLRHNIRIIMVFDGRHLPAKAETERKRREARKESEQLAKKYLRSNEIKKARSHMQRAIDVTHEMALQLIKACRDRGVDCIVAPYEADAQMAWLNVQGLAEYVVTEDSDLTLFGARKILFKLDLNGKALLVENTKLYLAMGCRPEKYNFDKFRRMCILSGCDYLSSLHGIGLKKACKFILTTEEDDMAIALKKIPTYLKMDKLKVTDKYIESFFKAEATFKHMYVYNPLERKMERLHELDEFQTDERHCINAGSMLDSNEQALQLALGNLNPFTLKQLDDWHPNRIKSKKYESIWLRQKNSQLEEPCEYKQHCTEESDPVLHFKKIEFKNMAEMEIAAKLSEERSKLEESQVFSIYKCASPKMERTPKRRRSSAKTSEDEEIETKSYFCGASQKQKHNPFAKMNTSLEKKQNSPVCSNNSLLKLLSPKKNNTEDKQQEALESKKSVKSRFFVENMQHSRKYFAARDLTSEMLNIEKKTNKYMDQQQDLYSCSFQSPKSSIEENEKKCFDNPLADSSNQNNEIENIKYTAEAPATESINSSQESTTFECSVLKEEIILLSDIEESTVERASTLSTAKKFTKKSKVIISKTNKSKYKAQATSRKVNNGLGTVDQKQLKLSMFGFQNRPIIKKS